MIIQADGTGDCDGNNSRFQQSTNEIAFCYFRSVKPVFVIVGIHVLSHQSLESVFTRSYYLRRGSEKIISKMVIFI